MKSIAIKAIIILGSLVALSGCTKDKDAPNEEAVQLSKLTQNWKLISVTKDNVELEGYENFTLTLSGTLPETIYTYAVIDRPELSPWPAGGTWSFGSSLTAQIVRDSGTGNEMIMVYTVTDTALRLEFDFIGTGYSNAHANSVEGHWIFRFGIQ